jgi:hypothetical protein
MHKSAHLHIPTSDARMQSQQRSPQQHRIHTPVASQTNAISTRSTGYSVISPAQELVTERQHVTDTNTNTRDTLDVSSALNHSNNDEYNNDINIQVCGGTSPTGHHCAESESRRGFQDDNIYHHESESESKNRYKQDESESESESEVKYSSHGKDASSERAKSAKNRDLAGVDGKMYKSESESEHLIHEDDGKERGNSNANRDLARLKRIMHRTKYHQDDDSESESVHDREKNANVRESEYVGVEVETAHATGIDASGDGDVQATGVKKRESSLSDTDRFQVNNIHKGEALPGQEFSDSDRFQLHKGAGVCGIRSNSGVRDNKERFLGVRDVRDADEGENVAELSLSTEAGFRGENDVEDRHVHVQYSDGEFKNAGGLGREADEERRWEEDRDCDVRDVHAQCKEGGGHVRDVHAQHKEGGDHVASADLQIMYVPVTNSGDRGDVHVRYMDEVDVDRDEVFGDHRDRDEVFGDHRDRDEVFGDHRDRDEVFGDHRDRDEVRAGHRDVHAQSCDGNRDEIVVRNGTRRGEEEDLCVQYDGDNHAGSHGYNHADSHGYNHPDSHDDNHAGSRSHDGITAVRNNARAEEGIQDAHARHVKSRNSTQTYVDPRVDANITIPARSVTRSAPVAAHGGHAYSLTPTQRHSDSGSTAPVPRHGPNTGASVKAPLNKSPSKDSTSGNTQSPHKDLGANKAIKSPSSSSTQTPDRKSIFSASPKHDPPDSNPRHRISPDITWSKQRTTGTTTHVGSRDRDAAGQNKSSSGQIKDQGGRGERSPPVLLSGVKGRKDDGLKLSPNKQHDASESKRSPNKDGSESKRSPNKDGSESKRKGTGQKQTGPDDEECYAGSRSILSLAQMLAVDSPDMNMRLSEAYLGLEEMSQGLAEVTSPMRYVCIDIVMYVCMYVCVFICVCLRRTCAWKRTLMIFSGCFFFQHFP